MYSQVMYCLDRVGALVKEKPELKKVERLKTVLSGDREAIAKLPMAQLEKILSATLTGMSTEQIEAEVKQWVAHSKNPHGREPYRRSTNNRIMQYLSELQANVFN